MEEGRGGVCIGERMRANENVVAAYGHVSLLHPRDPQLFFLARSLSPDRVERGDIMEFDLEGSPAGGDARQPYLERFIHAAAYAARADVQAEVHAHAGDVLPFSVTPAPLRPVIPSVSFMG